MPLLISSLESGLESVASSPPATTAECALSWADAVQSYAAGIVPPSSTVTAAAATLSGGLAGAFGLRPAAAQMELAFAAFALAVGGGMAGFVATPPAGAVGFATQFSTIYGDHAAAASAVAGIIDTWMRTGTATPTAGGPPVPWS